MEKDIGKLRHLIIQEDKTLDDTYKVSLDRVLKIAEIQRKQVAELDDKNKYLNAKIEELQYKQQLYENIIADMADEIDMDKEEYLIESYKTKWGLK